MCRWHKQFELDSQLPFLCGDSLQCRTLGHPAAVAATIANIEASYAVVGVLEMLAETIAVLECLMPDMMAGLGEVRGDGITLSCDVLPIMTRCTATAMCTRRAPTPRCPPP